MKEGKIWFISDTHFGHNNILKYTQRPFKTIEQMDKKLISNWNKTICKNDIVYFLGDLSFSPEKYLPILNGNIKFILGNHDEQKRINNFIEIYHRLKLKINNEDVLLVHDPRYAEEHTGWVIHGHLHNNDLVNYPIVNTKTKTINVCVELWNYKPISLDIIEKIIRG